MMKKIDSVYKESRRKSKVEMMDDYFHSNGNKINSSEICKVVKLIFEFDLDTTPILLKESQISKYTTTVNEVSLARTVIDSILNQHHNEVTSAEIREIINQIFGINLNAISSLEGSRISLFSKDQWIVQHDKDLFLVHTGIGDIDVKILPTKYYTELTGITELPNDLQISLTNLGYSYDETIGGYYFSNHSGEAVPDAFKGQTMGVILKVIQESLSHL